MTIELAKMNKISVLDKMLSLTRWTGRLLQSRGSSSWKWAVTGSEDWRVMKGGRFWDFGDVLPSQSLGLVLKMLHGSRATRGYGLASMKIVSVCVYRERAFDRWRHRSALRQSCWCWWYDAGDSLPVFSLRRHVISLSDDWQRAWWLRRRDIISRPALAGGHRGGRSARAGAGRRWLSVYDHDAPGDIKQLATSLRGPGTLPPLPSQTSAPSPGLG